MTGRYHRNLKEELREELEQYLDEWEEITAVESPNALEAERKQRKVKRSGDYLKAEIAAAEAFVKARALCARVK